MREIDDARVELSAMGVARIPCVFTREEMDEVRLAAERAAKSTNDDYAGRYITHKNGQPSLMFWPSKVETVLNSVRTDPRVVEIVRGLLGDEVFQVLNQIHFRSHKDGDSFCWHQDAQFRSDEHFAPEVDMGYVQTMIAVDDIGADNSPIEFLVGMHHKRDPRFMDHKSMRKGFKRGGLEGIRYQMSSGDMLLWTPLIPHGSDKNASGRARMTYVNGFARADVVRPGVMFPVYLAGGRVAVDLEVSRCPS